MKSKTSHSGSAGRGFAAIGAGLLLAWSGTSLFAQGLLDGLAARWDFEEGSGPTAYDTSGSNANHGNLDNFSGDNSRWVEGRFGGGLAFTGQASNRLIVPNDPSIAGDLVNGFSVAAWFKPNVPIAGTGTSTYAVLEKGNMFFFLQTVAAEGGGMNFLLKKGGANLTVGIVDGLEADTWYHLVGVFDGAESRVYLNGELRGALPVEAPIDTTDLALVIGGDDGTRTFNGTIDQVLIWNRALSDAEVTQVASGNVPAPPGGAPTISTPPQATSRYAGATARLSVGAAGAPPLRYLWYKGEEPLRSETGSTLVIEHLSPADAGAYKVRVSNDSGEVFSPAVALDVLPVEGLATARVLYLPLNETSGLTATDASGTGNPGTLLDFPDATSQWGPGQVGGSLGFEGTSSRVSVNDSASLNGIGDEVSFAFWVNLATFGAEQTVGSGASVYVNAASYVLRKGDHFGIKVINDPGSVLRTITVRGGAGADNGGVARQGWELNALQNSLELNQWQHLAVVYRNGMVTFYKNGFRLGDAAAGSLGSPNSAPLILGDFDEVFTQPRLLNGRLDEVGIWKRPLSEAEILELAGKDVSGAPVIAKQPAGQKRLEGAAASFEVFVTGKRPLEYQWLLNEAPIEGATANTLSLSRLKPADAGSYQVRVTNGEGTAVSDVAVLDVEPLDAITSGLLAYYAFDEIVGNTLPDASGNGLNGTLANMDASAVVPGQIGGAFQFDGEDDHIVIPHSDVLNLTTPATVSLWLKIDGLSGGTDYDRVLRKTSNFDFALMGSGAVRVNGIGKTPYDSPGGSWATGVWTHFAYVYSNGTLQWYKNGEPIGDARSAQIGELSADPLVIGNFDPGTATPRFYWGQMDDLGIWQRALSALDLLGIYENGLAGKALNVEFEPLNVRGLALNGGILNLTFYSPFSSGRELVIERGDAPAGGTWSAQEDVTLTDQGEGLYLAAFPAPAQTPAFYRVAAVPPPPLFADNFEGDAAGWTHGGEQDKWEHGTPASGPGMANSGTKVYATGLAENIGPYTDAWLHSPVIDLTGVGAATLRFAEWHNIDSNPSFHSATVNILDASSQAVLAEVNVGAGATGGWQQRTYRLTGDAVGRRVILEFRLITDDFNLMEGWFIDDVSVTEE